LTLPFREFASFGPDRNRIDNTTPLIVLASALTQAPGPNAGCQSSSCVSANFRKQPASLTDLLSKRCPNSHMGRSQDMGFFGQ
jgi:hypothetical protein